MTPLEELERLESAATPGPWAWDNAKQPDDWEIENGIVYPYVPECSHLGDTGICLDNTYENSREDCALVAALRNQAPQLIAAARFVEEHGRITMLALETAMIDTTAAKEALAKLRAGGT